MGVAGAIWGIMGVCWLLSYAIVRLSRIGLDSFAYEYGWYHWVALIACVGFMAYSEGYAGFQQAFSPRFAARMKHLRDYPKLAHTLLAPLFGMGYFHATRKRMITSYVMVAMIVLFVSMAHQLPQPWRGILDIGVVVGLTWGVVTVLAYSFQALTRPDFPYSPELPEQPPAGRRQPEPVE